MLYLCARFAVKHCLKIYHSDNYRANKQLESCSNLKQPKLFSSFSGPGYEAVGTPEEAPQSAPPTQGYDNICFEATAVESPVYHTIGETPIYHTLAESESRPASFNEFNRQTREDNSVLTASIEQEDGLSSMSEMDEANHYEDVEVLKDTASACGNLNADAQGRVAVVANEYASIHKSKPMAESTEM